MIPALILSSWLPLVALANSPAKLLDAAEAAEREGHLVYPASGSAMSIYHEVLTLEADNEHAIAGLSRIAEDFLEQAQAAMNRHALLKADALISRARMVYPDYPGLPAISAQLERLEQATRTFETLDWRKVAARDATLSPQLARLADVARAGDCRVTIQVSNDAEGRWVYQQLNGAPGTGRIRAGIEIASPAAIEILCFADA